MSGDLGYAKSLGHELAEVRQQIIPVLPGGIADALGVRGLLEFRKPSARIVERVGIVISAGERTEAQLREERQAQYAALVIPRDDAHLFRDVIPGAGVVALDEIVVSVGIVVGIEHVGPDPDVHFWIDVPEHLELLAQALPEELTHVSAPACFAGSTLADFVHAKDVTRRRGSGVHAARHIAPDLVCLRLAHADSGLAVIDREAMIVADAQALAIFDATAWEHVDRW